MPTLNKNMSLQNGSLEKIGDRQVWYGHYYIPFLNENGQPVMVDGKTKRRHRKARVGFVSELSKAQAKEELRKIIREEFAKLGQPVADKKDGLTLSEYLAQHWYIVKKNDWRDESTAESNAPMFKMIEDAFGKRVLSDIKYIELCGWIGNLVRDGYTKKRKRVDENGNTIAVDDKDENGNPIKHDYSKGYIRHLIQYVKSMFDEAVEEKFIDVDPAYRLKIPNMTKTVDKTVLTWEQVAVFQNAADESDVWGAGDRLMLETEFMTGMRPQELVPLRIKDFDGEALHVRRTFVRGKIRTYGKTEPSIRTVPVAAGLAAKINHYIKNHHPDGNNPDALLFVGPEGKMWDKQYFLTHLIRPLAKQLDLKLNFRIMRRTWATLGDEERIARAAQGGQQPTRDDMKPIFGHSKDSDVMATVYIQPTERKANLIAEMMYGKLKESRSNLVNSASA